MGRTEFLTWNRLRASLWLAGHISTRAKWRSSECRSCSVRERVLTSPALSETPVYVNNPLSLLYQAVFSSRRHKPDVPLANAEIIRGARPENSWSSHLEIARTATSEKLPGTAFSTVVVSRT
jgi:hypothetical protein